MLRGLSSLAPALLACLLMPACIGDPRAHLEKAHELAYQRRAQEALDNYEEVLSLTSKKPASQVRSLVIPALKGAGDLCYLETHDLSKAVEYYRELASRFPDAPETRDARANLADIFRSLHDRRAAVAELIALVQAFPDSPDADRYQYLAAKDYFELRDYDQAIIEANVLQDRFPYSSFAADGQMLVASSFLLMGKREKAVDAYETLCTRWPGSDLVARARFEQARVLAELGKDERAIEVLVEALKTHPNPRGVQAEIARLRRRIATRRAPAVVEHQDAFPEWYRGGGNDR